MSENIEAQALMGLYIRHKDEELTKILPPSQKPLYIDIAPNHPGAGYQANTTMTRSYSSITKDLYTPMTTFALKERPVINYLPAAYGNKPTSSYL